MVIGWLYLQNGGQSDKQRVERTYIYTQVVIATSSTAQGGGGSFRIGNL